ncbi:unnamed protein product [Linum tenue]|uniref:Uncharacterized protein n=1 Tax=Linum tenue TaxID=586396 RepID=A0AAV0LEX7_9ROSI|nr:unnamed protein product [Linum tenue]CAI0625878.1 unnamed protein product [Linum tenue]
MSFREEGWRPWMVSSWQDGRSFPRGRFQHPCWSYQRTV